MRKYVLHELASDTPKEFHGISWNHYFSKAFDQLRGLCCGILADGEITDAEAQYFRNWTMANALVEQVWPFCEIAARVEAIFADEVISHSERQELREIMDQIIDGQYIPSPGDKGCPWEMVYTKPEPSEILFSGTGISLTGKFAFGSRKKIVEKIETLGGYFHDTPRRGTSYLIIGEFGSINWKNSNYGNKIEAARELSKSGEAIHIVRESLFAKHAGHI